MAAGGAWRTLLLQRSHGLWWRGQVGIALPTGQQGSQAAGEVSTALWEQWPANTYCPVCKASFLLSVLFWAGVVLCFFTVSPCSLGRSFRESPDSSSLKHSLLCVYCCILPRPPPPFFLIIFFFFASWYRKSELIFRAKTWIVLFYCFVWFFFPLSGASLPERLTEKLMLSLPLPGYQSAKFTIMI